MFLPTVGITDSVEFEGDGVRGVLGSPNFMGHGWTGWVACMDYSLSSACKTGGHQFSAFFFFFYSTCFCIGSYSSPTFPFCLPTKRRFVYTNIMLGVALRPLLLPGCRIYNLFAVKTSPRILVLHDDDDVCICSATPNIILRASVTN